jgi:Zn-finger nucleic acid-binding protein
MHCPNCTADMEALNLAAHMGSVDIDLCADCQGFWFDAYESLKLAPAGTLRLFGLIGDSTKRSRRALATVLRCPRCRAQLRLTNDMQRNTGFRYWKCPSEHGRFITFFEFLREKNFVRPLTAQQIDDLRRNVHSVNCSNCGAAVDLAHGSTCEHCGTPLSMLDMNQAESVVTELRRAAEPRPIDPALPLELARARREVDALFATEPQWWKDASSVGLVQAGLSALMSWVTKR